MNDISRVETVDYKILKSALDNLVDSFITIDHCGTIKEANPATEKHFGYSLSELIGQNVKILMGEPDHNQHDQYLKNYLTTGIAKIIGIGREVTGRRKNGELFPVELAVSRVEVNGETMFAGILRDISQRKEAERQEQMGLIMEMSTPILSLWDDIILLPVIGIVDSKRAQMIMERVLESILHFKAKVLVMDIQGVPNVDSAVANHFLKITKATRLMGCECLITGISPEVSQALVYLGIELKEVLTRSDLKDGVTYALQKIGMKVSRG